MSDTNQQLPEQHALVRRKTKILHVEVPSEIFNEAKIQSLKQDVAWHEFVIGLLRQAGSPCPS